MSDYSDYEGEVEAGATWLGEWLRLVLQAEFPSASVTYEGAAANTSRMWRVRTPGAERWIGVTEPALLEPQVRDLPLLLEKIDWSAAWRAAEPEDLLVSAGGRVFAWDRQRDRGTRLLEL